jgi:DnaJ family protein C protein 3
MRLLALALLLIAGIGASADSAGLYPPGLLPIINRANGLFSAGQYNDAARAYSEAIGTCMF